MALTSHLGFGRFQLADFQPGECFARFDGTLAKLIDPQPPGRPDHILVWNNHETSNAERLWLHRTALAYAVSPEQARMIAQRAKKVRPKHPERRDNVIVNRDDGRCRSCGGQLKIMDADDCSMSVTCTECADSYDVEPDAFGDGCMTYYFPMMVERLEAGGDQ